jgi:hypothetical protein
MSQLLEIHHQGGVLKRFKVSKKAREIADVRNILKGEKEPLDISEEDILKMVMQK